MDDLVTLLCNQKVPTIKYRAEEEKDRAAVTQSGKQADPRSRGIKTLIMMRGPLNMEKT